MAKHINSAISPSPYKVTKKCVKKQFKIWRIKKKAITLHSQWRTNGSGRKGNPKQLSPESKTYTNGEMAEWSIAAVLKTVEGHTSGGSNPSLSANKKSNLNRLLFLLREAMERTPGFVIAKRLRSKNPSLSAKTKKQPQQVAFFINNQSDPGSGCEIGRFILSWIEYRLEIGAFG